MIYPNIPATFCTQTRLLYEQSRNQIKKHILESIPNRIVSISKPYVRPIVRGKENKTVEFGAKSNNILIDGISFIEKVSFNAFNEGTRLRHCISLSQKLTGVPVKKVGGDQGYSGNDNRTFCKDNNIEKMTIPIILSKKVDTGNVNLLNICLFLNRLLSEFAVRTEYVHNLVDVHLLHVLTSRLQILTWVEVSRMLSEVLTDGSSHGQTRV